MLRGWVGVQISVQNSNFFPLQMWLLAFYNPHNAIKTSRKRFLRSKVQDRDIQFLDPRGHISALQWETTQFVMFISLHTLNLANISFPTL